MDLHPYLRLQERDEEAAIRASVGGTITETPPTAFQYLEMLSDAIHARMTYSRRDTFGTQTAAETIRKREGTCRDFAFLFMEVARLKGFAACFVTGYLHSPAPEGGGMVGTSATHAWADVSIPGEGWIEFDPTNRIVAGRSLIRVATTRTPGQASPIYGGFAGAALAFLSQSVGVHITEFEKDGWAVRVMKVP